MFIACLSHVYRMSVACLAHVRRMSSACLSLAVEADAKRQNLPLPPGYYEVLGIAKPA